MPRWLWVGVGGFIGAAMRYLVTGWVHRLTNGAIFPYGTLSVNLIGSLLIGLLMGLAERFGIFPVEARLLLVTGCVGGFTTFSSFAYETDALLRDGQMGPALTNMGLHMGVGLLAVRLGWTLIQQL